MAPEEFRVGEAVRILDGPFVNFVGVDRHRLERIR